MKHSDELRIAIREKRAELITAKNAAVSEKKDFEVVKKLAEELNLLLDELKAEEVVEQSDLQNFLKHAKPLNAMGGAGNFSGGVQGEEYKTQFFNQVRAKFGTVQNSFLQESIDTSGGYLVPSEFHTEIITELKQDNIFRQIAHVVNTSNDRQIAIQTTPPVAAFVQEGDTIPLTVEQFDRRVLRAYKIAAGVSVSNELLADSFYNIEKHLCTEFAKSIGVLEEQAFLTGTGVNEPLGILPQMLADSSTTITTTDPDMVSDSELTSLVYSLKRPYRQNASWLVNDKTLGFIRQLKDANLNNMWQPSMALGEPSSLLGYPVYTSEFVPDIAAGNIPILFGDFTKFLVGQRGELAFKPLRELHALQDLTTFLMIERVDGVLTDDNAIRGLKMR